MAIHTVESSPQLYARIGGARRLSVAGNLIVGLCAVPLLWVEYLLLIVAVPWMYVLRRYGYFHQRQLRHSTGAQLHGF
jgi:hypothetical protein